jgi:transcription initiation factor TFIID subunit 5
LKKRGFKQTETVLRGEAKLQNVDESAFLTDLEDNVNVANYIMFYNPNEATPERYQESYAAFREWIMNSALDMYRVIFIPISTYSHRSQQELSTLLYPMFIHCYLDLVAKNFSTDGKLNVTLIVTYKS